jgi:Flp pilus assembly CpaE family ATPase
MTSPCLTTALVSPDPAVHRQLQEALESGFMVEAIWSISEYPELPALERLKEAPSGCVLFLDFSDPARARRIAAELDRAYPTVSVVAIYTAGTKDEIIGLMQLGIREVIDAPLSSPQVTAAFVRASKKLKTEDSASGNVYAFLPAQPGAGATTVAISTACAVARISKQRTLLLDFDLRFGITSFLLKLDGLHSVQDALNASEHLDEDFWGQLVTRRDTLEMLGSAPAELPSQPRGDQYAAVLNYSQSQYAAIVVDLPGALEPHELETLNRAKEIFLVFKADVTGLHLAKRKSEALRRLGLNDRVSAIVNQAVGQAPLPLTEIEKLLQLPARFLLPKDEQALTRAVLEGMEVEATSKLGAQIEVLAKSIVGTAIARPSPARTRRFLSTFSVSPTRNRDRWGF